MTPAVLDAPSKFEGSGSQATKGQVAAWILLAVVFAAATVANGLASYPALLGVFAVVAGVMAFLDERTAVVLIVGVPALDSFGIVVTAPQAVTVFQVVLVASVAGAAWRLRSRLGSLRPRFTAWDLGIAVFLIAAAVSVPRSYSIAHSLIGSVEVAAFVCMYLLLSRVTVDAGDRERVSITVVAVGSYSAIVALGQAFLPKFPVPLLEMNATGNAIIPYRASAFFANPNTLGILLVLTAMLSLERLVRSTALRARILGAIALFLCALGIAVTFSREGYLGLLVGAAVFAWMALPNVRAAVTAAVIVAVIVVAISMIPGVGTRAETLLRFPRDPSAMDRVYLSQVSIKMFEKDPAVGVGISAFRDAYPSFPDPRVTVNPVTDGHQMPFAIPAETGVLGLIAELTLLGTLAIVVARGRRLYRMPGIGPVAGIAATSAFFAMSFSNTLTFFEPFWIALALVGAVMLAGSVAVIPLRMRGPQEQIPEDDGSPSAADGTAPLVSILTPSYNQATWLAHNLRSVACQTYPNIEHVVMDGGSTDDSVAVLQAAGGSVLWRSEPDKGQSDAVNRAFLASKGEIIGWINSDDAYFDCRVVEDVVAFFSAHPDVDVVYGHAAQVSEDGTIIWMIWVPWFMRRVLRIVNFIGQPVAFIRRSALSDPMLDESYDFAMDYELWLRLDRNGHRFHRIPRITAVDRHQRARKGVTMTDVLHSDLERLAESHGRGYPRGKKLLSWGFYAWRRFMGVFLIPRIPHELAFTDKHTRRWDIFRRQALSWNKAWPADYDPGA